MSKKPVSFRLDMDTIKLLDKLATIFTNELGVKFDRTKVVEKLVRDGFKNIKNT